VRLEPLYRIRFTYPEQWGVSLGGDWEQHFAVAEGRCEGEVSGRFRGANYPRRRGDGTFRPDFRAVIETDDGATIMFDIPLERDQRRRDAEREVAARLSSSHASQDDLARDSESHAGFPLGTTRRSPALAGGH